MGIVCLHCPTPMPATPDSATSCSCIWSHVFCFIANYCTSCSCAVEQTIFSHTQARARPLIPRYAHTTNFPNNHMLSNTQAVARRMLAHLHSCHPWYTTGCMTMPTGVTAVVRCCLFHHTHQPVHTCSSCCTGQHQLELSVLPDGNRHLWSCAALGCFHHMGQDQQVCRHHM